MARSVLDGRQLSYRRIETASSRGCDYEVRAVGKGRPILLGVIERGRRSTDRPLGRLRKPGKGAVEWHAIVPEADWAKHPRLEYHPPLKYVVGTFYYGFRLESSGHRGSSWDTRQEAAEVLVKWYDHPQLREDPVDA